MKVVLLTSDSPAQRALAQRFVQTEGVDLVGVVVQHIPSTRNAAWVRSMLRRNPRRVADKVAQRILLGGTVRAVAAAEGARFGGPDWPTGSREVSNINGPETVAALRSWDPDLIAVSGTRIVRQPVFDLAPPLGLLNLHTGLSPFYRGGPNCTLWCLARHEPQFIGATVHVLDPEIDRGPILSSATTPIEIDSTLENLVWETVALGHGLYAEVLAALAGGGTLRSLPQDEIGDGRTFFTREWGYRPLREAVAYVDGGGLARWVAEGRPGLEHARTVDLDAPEDGHGTVTDGS